MNSPASTDRLPSEVFREVYNSGLWSPHPWNSGSGSDPSTQGRPYIQAVSSIINFNRIQNVVDLGCGDGRILASLAFCCPGVRFHGVDCCPEIIELLKLALPHHDWRCNEMATTQDLWQIPLLPRSLYLVKDVMHHWETERILFFLDQMVGKNRLLTQDSVLLVTNDCRQVSPADDCTLGGYRALCHTMFPLAQYRPRVILEYLHKSILLIQ